MRLWPQAATNHPTTNRQTTPIQSRSAAVGHATQVRIRLKHMELEIRRRETTGAGASAHSESETIAKYEIMDGAPVRGESIPIR